MDLADIWAVILCGGKGTRAYPHTLELPKPLLEVAGRPVLRHVLEIYARQGTKKFVLAAGFKAALIRDFATGLPGDWEVRVLDTGEEAGTARRILSAREHLDGTFFATYGDGLADVDLPALLAFHRSQGTAATITTVPLPSQYGTVDIDGSGRVTEFREKPRLTDHWINGGFFAFEAEVFRWWEGDDLERDVLPLLARQGQLSAYRHHGFWKSMDTYKDAMELGDLAASGEPPWLRPPRR